MAHFLYKLVPPRPSFADDMDDTEANAMGDHVVYWQDQLGRGTVVVFGAVADPAGVWGVAVLETDTVEDGRALIEGDPVVASGICTYEIHPMSAVARPHR